MFSDNYTEIELSVCGNADYNTKCLSLIIYFLKQINSIRIRSHRDRYFKFRKTGAI